MKKTIRFTAIVLAVVLALSCFTVAFAENINIYEEIETYFTNLGESLKQGDLEGSAEIVKARAKVHYDRMHDTEGNVVIPQIKEHAFLKLKWCHWPEAQGWEGGTSKTIYKHELLKFMLDNPILDQLEEWSLTPLTWALNGIGKLMNWEKPGA